jgi:type IV fimbrial biogenesis protein FimT
LYPEPACQRRTLARGARSRLRAAQRGFSLIELIVVVIIVSVLAALAIPSITARVRDRRTQQAAQEVMTLYRNARMRAMGRGSAVLVRYDNSGTPEGQFQMREAVRGATTDPNCSQLPVNTCLLPSWADGNPDNRVLSSFEPAIRAEYAGVNIVMNGPPPTNATPQNQVDICFTPMGRAFVRFNNAPGTPFEPLTGVPVADVWRQGTDGSPVGLTRHVMILPNGHARFGASEAPP